MAAITKSKYFGPSGRPSHLSRRSSIMRFPVADGKHAVFKRITRSVAGKSCPICLCRLDERRAVVIIPCEHSYCTDCIRKWSQIKRNCPLCNVQFDSWFSGIDFCRRSFWTEKLKSTEEVKMVNSNSRWRSRLAERRIIRRSREELNVGRSRTRPLPRRRSFGLSGETPPDVIAERVIQWRASIYEQRLQAIPLSCRNCFSQKVAANICSKELIARRIEPWIRRELQAILGDPDPSVIVHVATSLFTSTFDKEHRGSSRQQGVEDNFLLPLRPFLLEVTDMFWHELRCFVESQFPMETYDSIVEYQLLDQGRGRD